MKTKIKIASTTHYELMNVNEVRLTKAGYKLICGVDEVGRGPLAGPVVVAAVILDPNQPIDGLMDSKKLSKKKIKNLSTEIIGKAIAYKITKVGVYKIEKIGIKKAVHLAMRRAVNGLEIKPDCVLIDFEYVNFQNKYVEAITKGDNVSNSIAAASIIAKNYRDEYMEKLGKKHSEYQFCTNAGYGTKAHIQAIEKYGIIEGVHRRNFEPIRSQLESED